MNRQQAIHQRSVVQKEESSHNKSQTNISASYLTPSKSEASLQPLSIHYSHLKDMEALGKEITQKTIQAIQKPGNTSTRIQRVDGKGNSIIEEIKQAKKVCSTCLMKDLSMYPANYKFHAEGQCHDKSHPVMMQDPEKTGNRKIRVIKKSTGSAVTKNMSYEPPIHSMKDLEIEKLRDDNIKLLQKIEESDAAYQKLQLNVIQKMKALIEELINFLNKNGINLTDNAIENQRLASYISDFTPKNDDQSKQLDKLQRRNKGEFELNIQNDDLKQKLRNLQDLLYGNTFFLNRQPIDQAKDNIIDSQKNRIHNQNKNIARLGDMLLKLNQADNPDDKMKILTEKVIEFSNEIEKARQEAFNSKKSMDEANTQAYRYMDKVDKVINVVQKYPLVFVSFVDRIKMPTLEIDVFESDVARAQNLLSKESLQYENTIKILKDSNQEKIKEISNLQNDKQRLEELMYEKDQMAEQRFQDQQKELLYLSKMNKEQLDSINQQHEQNLKQQQDQKQFLEQQIQRLEQEQLEQQQLQDQSISNSSPSFIQDIYAEDNSQKIIDELTRIILNQKNFQDEDSKKALRQIFGKRYVESFKFFEKQMNELNQKNKNLTNDLQQEKQSKQDLHDKIQWYTKLLISIHQKKRVINYELFIYQKKYGLNQNNLECLEQDMNIIQQDYQSSMMAEVEDPTLLGRISALNGRFSEFNQLYLPPQRESRVSYINESKQEEINKLVEQNKDLLGTINQLEGKLSLLESDISYLQLQNQQLQKQLQQSKNSKEVQDLKKEIENLVNINFNKYKKKQLNESFFSENSPSKTNTSRQNTPTRYKSASTAQSNQNTYQKSPFDDNSGKNLSKLNISSISEFPQNQQNNLDNWYQMLVIQALTIEEFLVQHQNEQSQQEEDENNN